MANVKYYRSMFSLLSMIYVSGMYVPSFLEQLNKRLLYSSIIWTLGLLWLNYIYWKACLFSYVLYFSSISVAELASIANKYMWNCVHGYPSDAMLNDSEAWTCQKWDVFSLYNRLQGWFISYGHFKMFVILSMAHKYGLCNKICNTDVYDAIFSK